MTNGIDIEEIEISRQDYIDILFEQFNQAKSRGSKILEKIILPEREAPISLEEFLENFKDDIDQTISDKKKRELDEVANYIDNLNSHNQKVF